MLDTILVNYQYDPEWLRDYPELNPITIYDRSDDGIERDLTKYGKVFKTKNTGNVDYDKLGWLIQNYHELPEVFLWSKTNIFKFTEPETLREAIQKREFKPLTKNHVGTIDQFGVVSYMQDGLYWERNDGVGWYTNQMASNCIWAEWCKHFAIQCGPYIPFAPGGSYILTRERVQRYGVDFYKEMRDTLDYATLPAEAHHAERSYFLLWK